MNKEHFLIELKLNLTDLPPEKVSAILAEYEEKFAAELTAGKFEEQIANELGHPKQLAAERLIQFGIKPKPKEASYSQGDWVELDSEPGELNDEIEAQQSYSPFVQFIKAVFIIGFNLFFVLIPMIVLLFCLLGAWITGIAFSFAPIFGIFALLGTYSVATVFQTFMTILICGIGLVMLAVCYSFTRVLTKLFRRYLVWMRRAIVGGRLA
ncbi:DUF1700 domain-containing protein [Carnobacterium antarcticum]|uniref:DUF1700 domain-containing protein n=1 Tax=Carnobacterium antarcticum TaxID=2126436 RepID=A0ABW4NNU7_9LACT|nr:DUF1700 domain-containing protein [Carnobacterium sp. CP1]ALV22862.1 hypothetical protein NY10_2277 [Carnobacterium sp. CP1]